MAHFLISPTLLSCSLFNILFKRPSFETGEYEAKREFADCYMLLLDELMCYHLRLTIPRKPKGAISMIPNNRATFMVQCLDLNLRPYDRGESALQFCYPSLVSAGRRFEAVMFTIYRVSHKRPPHENF